MAGVFGLRGELKIAPSRAGTDALAPGVAVRLALSDGTSRTLRVRTLRLHQQRPLLAFEGIDDATAAQALVGAELFVDRADVAMEQDEYFDDDLVGCVLVGVDGVELGTVVAVEHYPAQDVLLVGPARAMVPLVRAFIGNVDVAARRITVDLPPGLLEPALADEA